MRRILRRAARADGLRGDRARARGVRAADGGPAGARGRSAARRRPARGRAVRFGRVCRLPPHRRDRCQRPRRAGPDTYRQPQDARRGHPAEQSRHADGLDRQQPGDQAEQPDAALHHAFGRRAAGDHRLPGAAAVKSETGFDPALLERFPTKEARPDDELTRLEEAWRAPKGWGLLTAVNNNYIGTFYVGAAFLFFLLAGVLALVMRVQLALPLQGVLPQETYNQFFTMHGTLMMFLFAVPMM